MVFEALRICSRSIPLILALTVTGSAAQQDLRAPVNVALELYRGCLIARAMTDGFAPKEALADPQIAVEYLNSVDEYCLGWTVIWTPSLTGQDVTIWSKPMLDRFSARRQHYLELYSYQWLGRAIR
jgi:hypothetical protein